MFQNPDEIFSQIRRQILRKWPTFRFDSLESAYLYAKEQHADTPVRLTGEPYICHPARVALSLTMAGMDTDIIAAAFLHDVIEDCGVTVEILTARFGGTVAKIVDAISALNKKATKHLTKEERDNRSYYKFLSNLPKADQAIYVKLADRLDNLRTMDNMPDERMLNKLQETEDFYLPLAESLNIHIFVDEIRERIYKLRNPDACLAIQRCYETILLANCRGKQATQNLIHDAIHGSRPETRDLLKLKVHHFDVQPRSISSLARSLEARQLDISSPGSLIHLSKYELPVYDMTLVMENTDISPVDAFFIFYDKCLRHHRIIINGFDRTTDKTQPYMLITDRTQITYRLFLHTVDSYHYYLYGLNSQSENERAAKLYDILMNYNDADPRKTYFPKITVHTKDNDDIFLEEGSTVLDFAFAIHRDVGLTMGSAVINNHRTGNLSTRLHNGDTVQIVSDPSGGYSAKLEWFRWVTTSRAKQELYKYFNHATIPISVYDMEKQRYLDIPKNSSVLDFLLLRENNSKDNTADSSDTVFKRICHIKDVIINDEVCPAPECLSLTLHHRNKINVSFSQEITFSPDISCFSYLNSKEARELLIQMLQTDTCLST